MSDTLCQTVNRKRICDLRLTSGEMAVHSDMLVWSKDETPEGATLPILDALYSTIQYSMVLATIAPAHREVPVAVPPAGLSRVEVPASGHLEIVFDGERHL